MKLQKAKVQSYKKQLTQSLCKESYFEFYKRAVKILEPQTDWSFNWHIEVLCNKLQEIVFNYRDGVKKTVNLQVNVPPGSSKSMIFSVCLLPWAWLHCPHLRISVQSYNIDLSMGFAVKSRSLINTLWYQEHYGEVFKLTKDQNTKSFFSNKNGGEMRSQINTGKHTDIVILDDLLNPTMAKSRYERENMNDFYFSTVPSRFKTPDRAITIIVQQRLHHHDLCGALDERGVEFEKIIIPANKKAGNVLPKELESFYDENDLFWSSRLNEQTLHLRKQDLGIDQYEAQYQQSTKPDGSAIFQKEWLVNRFNLDSEIGQILQQLPRHFYSDMSEGKNNNSDYQVIICYSIYQDKIYFWNIWRGKLTLPEYLRHHKKWLDENEYDNRSRDYFEPKSTGTASIQVLQEAGINAISGFNPNTSKEDRANNITAFLESGRSSFFVNVNWEDCHREIVDFPNVKNDDQVDVFVGAIIQEFFTKKKVESKPYLLGSIFEAIEKPTDLKNINDNPELENLNIDERILRKNDNNQSNQYQDSLSKSKFMFKSMFFDIDNSYDNKKQPQNGEGAFNNFSVGLDYPNNQNENNNQNKSFYPVIKII